MADSKLGLLAIAIVCSFAIAQAQDAVSLCIPATLTTEATIACTTLLNQYRTAEQAALVRFQCISGGSAQACVDRVTSGTADLTKFGGDGLYTAYERNLAGYAAELIEIPETQAPADPGIAYYSVAVTTKSVCDTIGAGISLRSFQDRRACSTGYRRTAGWILPMGFMVSAGIMPVVSREAAVEQDAETFASFFSSTCAPGTTAEGPASGGRKWEQLCTGCKGDCSADKARETYVDYEGSLKCLSESSGDIAFTKHTTLFDYTVGGSRAQSWSLQRSDLRLVCPSGGCRPLEDWERCNIARSATHTLVGRPGFTSTAAGRAAIEVIGNANSTMLLASRNIASNNPQVLFTNSALGMRTLSNQDIGTHLGSEAVTSFRASRNLQVPQARFCTISAAEQSFCRTATQLMNQRSLGVSFSCVQRTSDEDCLRAIRINEADLKAVDGPDVYNGFKDHQLKAIVAEDYATGDGVPGTEYFAVAVVNKQFCDSKGGNPTFSDLKGKRSCNTGYRRNAGWSMPVGFLLQSGVMPVVRNNPNVEDDAESMASFFSGGICAGRAVDNGPVNTEDRKGALWSPLCSKCKGDCSSNTVSEPYYDYAGAVRCLQEDGGDVAWTKHTVALDSALDGKQPQPWSKLPQSEMRLLCPSGGCAPLSQAYKCHIARAVAHAVMVRTSYPDSDRIKVALATIAKDAAFRNLVFNSSSNPSNFLFKSTTNDLVPINDDTRTYLGATLATFQGLDALNAGGNLGGVAVPSNQQSSDSGSGGLSGGAIAGIAIGCAVGGALLAAAMVVFIMKRKQSRPSSGLAGSLYSPSTPEVSVVKDVF